jgi:hypothetical protein
VPHPDVLRLPSNEEVVSFRAVGEEVAVDAQEPGGDQGIEQWLHRGRIYAERSGDLFGGERSVLDGCEDVEFHPGQHGEGRVDRHREPLDRLRAKSWLLGHRDASCTGTSHRPTGR